MSKRAFVLFFSLVQFMALCLLPGQSLALCQVNFDAGNFSPYAVQLAETEEDFVLCDDNICENETIVRADDFEWKENLSSLLRHRLSTYRFLTAVSETVPDYSIKQVPKVVRESIALTIINKGDIIRPGYYSFLHRLCPF